MHFQFDYFCSVATYDIIFCGRPLYNIKHLFYENDHKNDRILHTKFDWPCDVIFMVSNLYRSGCFIE